VTTPPSDEAVDEAGPMGSAPTALRGARHRLRYAVVGAVLVGAFVFLLVQGLGSALDYYLPVDQALHQRGELGARTFNLEGVVQPGSIRSTTNGVDFTVGSGNATLRVVNTGSPPQLFQPSIPVIAVGHFEGGTFVSDLILVKHSSNYIAAHPGRVRAANGTAR
jgi:cytochrome c-type biogenesis protein CcmE